MIIEMTQNSEITRSYEKGLARDFGQILASEIVGHRTDNGC